MSERPPTALVAGKYQIGRLIGRGGMGSVWEGRHATLGTRVAVKFIDSDSADRPEVQKRFENEAKAAATLQSKHAIQIYDHGIGEDGRPYIVMEYLEGEPLDARLNEVGTLSLVATTRLLQQVGRALTRAHERGIVHRDLKPENIFLSRDQEDDEEVAKVLDFGIAKISDANLGLSSATKTGAILGTPFYMAPEQARGLREVDYRADIWSLGVIAFRCVTGRLPFDGQSVGDLLVRICTVDPPVPSSLRPELPPSFDAWLKRSLARDPAERFASVSEQMDTLAFAAGVTLRRPASSRSNPGAVSVPAATLPLGTPPSEYFPTPAPPPAVAGITSTSLSTSTASLGLQRTRTRWLLGGVALLFVSLGALGSFVLYAFFDREDETTAAPVAGDVAAATQAPPTASEAPSAPDMPPPTSLASGQGESKPPTVTSDAGAAEPVARTTPAHRPSAEKTSGKTAPAHGKSTAPSNEPAAPAVKPLPPPGDANTGGSSTEKRLGF